MTLARVVMSACLREGCQWEFTVSSGKILFDWRALSRPTALLGRSSRAGAALAGALAATIFVVDAFSPLHIAAAVMYVAVVLLSANFCSRRGILLWGLACVILTLVSFLLMSNLTENQTGRTLVSILAIGTTTFLAMRIRSASDALRRSEAYLAEAQRLSRTGSFAQNIINGRHTWSDETYAIFEYDKSAKPTLELIQARVHPDDLDAWNKTLKRRQTTREYSDLQYRLLFPGGRVKHIHSLAHPVEGAGGELEYIGALMDITAAKKAEDELHEARAALARVTRVMTLGELMASISHEVNQPLAAIVTNGEACMRWLGRDIPDLEEARSAVERMIRDGRRASDVIRRLRALSRKDELQKAPQNLNEVINDTIPLIRRELLNHRVLLKLELAPKLPAVMGDKIQLQQVIINLVVNATQAMSTISERPRTLCIRSEPEQDAGVRVTVTDAGPGIDPGNRDQLFKAFFTTRDGGMGMGLSICRSIIEAHGGRLWGVSNNDFGATFGFSLKQDGFTLKQEKGAQ